MKRLTEPLDSGEVVYYLYGLGALDEIEALSECVDRLAAYENAGRRRDFTRIAGVAYWRHPACPPGGCPTQKHLERSTHHVSEDHPI